MAEAVRKLVGRADKKAYHKEYQRARRAYRRERLGSVDAPYDERVDSIVKLLKQLAQEYGQRKRSYKLPRRADGHVLCRTLIIHNASAPPPKLGIGFS